MPMILEPWIGEYSCAFKNANVPRPAYVTFGIDFRTKSSDPQGALTTLHSAFTTAVRAVLDADVTMGPGVVRLGQPTPDPPLLLTSAVFSAGTMAQNSLPANVAVLVTKITAKGGRRNRGRLYFPWLLTSTPVNEAGIISSSSVTVIQTALNGFMTGLGTNSTPMVINHSLGKSAVPSATPVTALIVSNLIGTQRRRLGR